MPTWVCLTGAFLVLGPGHWMARGDTPTLGDSPVPSERSSLPGDRPSIREEIGTVRATAKALGEKTPAYLDALEHGLKELRSRHPAESEVYVELLSVAVQRPVEPGLKLAREILEWPSPEPVKKKAQGVVRTRESLGNDWSMRLAGIDGRMLNSRESLGRVVLIHFWASWCAPCREELPRLKALLASQHSRGLDVFGVNFDESPKVLRRFVARDAITWPQHCAAGGLDGSVAREFGVTSLPMVWLIDRDGRLRDVNAREDLEAKVDRWLSTPREVPGSASLPLEPVKN